MNTIVVSDKFEISIPRSIRKALHIKRGQKLAVLAHDGGIRLVPIPTADKLIGALKGIEIPSEEAAAKMEGFAKGMRTDFQREEHDRF